MKSSNTFNTVWIIQSIAEGEMKTGTRLYEDTFTEIHERHENLKVYLEQPSNKREFVECLKKIYSDVKDNKNFPIIHLECHGGKTGLGLASNEIIEWDELRGHLIDINFSCGVNLLITIATCKGVYLIQVATQLDRAPFYAILGTDIEVYPQELITDYKEFYSAYFDTFNTNKALDALNAVIKGEKRSYYFIGAEKIFLNAFRKYHQDHCTGKAKRKRLEDLVSKAMKQPEVNAKGVTWVRNQAKEWFKSEQGAAFQKYKSRFFGLAEYPHNTERFSISYDDVISHQLQQAIQSPLWC